MTWIFINIINMDTFHNIHYYIHIYEMQWHTLGHTHLHGLHIQRQTISAFVSTQRKQTFSCEHTATHTLSLCSAVCLLFVPSCLYFPQYSSLLCSWKCLIISVWYVCLKQGTHTVNKCILEIVLVWICLVFNFCTRALSFQHHEQLQTSFTA